MHAPLDKALRRELERTVIQARQVAEHAAGDALRRLGVEEAKAPDYLNDEQRALRNRLRAHGRQLGDLRRPDGRQELGWLQGEIAYEHWHRMLFARFLEQNHLLMYDAHTPVTLEECNELAADEGCANGWQLAGRLASRMLPQIFREDSPALAVPLAPDTVRELENLIDRLAPATFTASDSLGWVYQFWQVKRKAEVNASGEKIGAKELSAVTQLFTEPYMVSFLLDNSLGAWWAARRLSEEDLRNARSEDELRRRAVIPGIALEYLRFAEVDDGHGVRRWVPAAGTFGAWPMHLGELKILDPCCGSGHFLVAAFLMLMPMRMEAEGLSAREAADLVLSENLYGLELDQRCVELAAFAVALEAWRYPGSGGYRKLPELHMACSGMSIMASRDEWREIGGRAGRKNLAIALEWMYQVFEDAPVLGSLINPRRSRAGQITNWNELGALLEHVISRESMVQNGAGHTLSSPDQDGRLEARIVAQGVTKALALLSAHYDLVITNVPYLKAGDQCAELKAHCEEYYPDSKYALESVFMERCHEFLRFGGCSAIVTQQYWLFLKYYDRLREKFIRDRGLGFIARLGPGAFDEISGEVVNVCLQLTFNEVQPSFYGIEVSACSGSEGKARALPVEPILESDQEAQLENPDFRISFEIDNSFGDPLSNYSDFGKGSVSGDGANYLRKFWEFMGLSNDRKLWLNSPDHDALFSGRQDVILWGGVFDPSSESGFAFRGQRVHGKKGVAIGKAGSFRFTPYTGEVFDDNVAVLKPKSDLDLTALWSYATSGFLQLEVKKLDKKMSVTAGTFTKVRVDIDQIRRDASERFPKGLPAPFSDDPSQWIFHGHPCGSVIWDEDSKWTVHGELRVDDTVLQVAVARLLGYRWPAELDPNMELAVEQREWVRRCDALLGLVDDDGIVCLPALRREKTAADRLEDMLQAAYGDSWSPQLRSKLLAEVSSRSLETWLRDKFFEQHCKLFQDRPFIWQVWDGQKDGFSALLNYHKLNRATMERLIYTYLGDWINRQEQALAEGVDGAEVLLAAARNLKKQLELILKGEAPYDIFVRWKPIEQQPIGWEPDLNDGVRLNIRPFLTVEDVGKKGTGVLRAKPNIKWGKDRGKDVETAPWYKLGLEYGEGEGARINDHHLTLAEKQAARDLAKNK